MRRTRQRLKAKRAKRKALKRRPFELVDHGGQRVARRPFPPSMESNVSETVARPLPPDWYSRPDYLLPGVSDGRSN